MTLQQAIAVALHRDLDRRLAERNGGRFISGYDTQHPFVADYLGNGGPHSDTRPFGSYAYPQDQTRLTDAIRAFHRSADGIDYSSDEILVTAGSSPLIASILIWLRQQGIEAASYLRPLYHTFYFFADRFGIRLDPVGDRPFWDGVTAPTLPDAATPLLFSDPIWFAGRNVHQRTVDQVSEWQRLTGSTVIIDGTFQYLGWQPGAGRAGLFDRTRTLRLICPTKSLALHGVRFAYLLGPSAAVQEILWIAQNMTGSSSVSDLRASMRMMQVLASPDANRQLIALIQRNYCRLRERGVLANMACEPECGYYVFGTLAHSSPTDLVMTSAYFDLDGYEGMVRVNLLNPELG